MCLTLGFDEIAATRREHAGGKGANLALLTQRGFPVPAGFVIPAAAYREFVASASGLTERVTALPFGEAAALREACEALRADLARLSFPTVLAEEIRARIAGWAIPPTSSNFMSQVRHKTARAWAVRSSSTLEDLASAAFAGQHDTFLNCIGAEQVLARVKDCWLSLWMDRAVAYRHRQRFDHQQAAMAVVVQQMIACDVAGVGFSVNPVSGELGEMIVDANFGLGESVVSGEAEVDHWVLDKATLAVRGARIAQKTRCVVGAGSTGGTQERPIDASDAMRPALTDAQLGEVGALLLRVEQSCAFPQDIEWGIAGGRVWLLQARPITTIPPRWTRDESAERFPNLISPLTWDFVEEGFHRSLNHSFRLMGFPAFNGKWFGLHGHYVYGNQNAVELYARRAPFTPPRSLDEVRMLIPTLRENFAWVQELPVAWHRDLDFYLLKIGEFMAEPLAARTPRELWEFVLRVNAHGAGYFLPNIAISISHGLLYRFLHGILQLAVGPARAAGLFDGLLAHCETKTGIINKELFELAQLARAQDGLEVALTKNGSRAVMANGGLAAWPEFQARLGKFLRDHGHREIEFDAYAPTWVEAPWVVLDNLRLILQGSLEFTPAMRERELKVRQQQAEIELYRALPPDLHFFFGEILRLTRLYTSLDDLEHYQTTRLTLPLRRGLRELGTRLVARGVVAEPMDIFFAHQAQIDAAFQNGSDASWRELAAQVRAQKRAYLEAKTRAPDWILDAGPDTAAHHAPGVNGTKADFLTGIAGSAGVAEGPVYVVQSSDDFAAFPKNAVLVARTTSPTWTPLFYNAAAVVTESGGPLSHGAVTAREMRIPAVMAVKGSLTRLRNGQRVRVDGSAGKVTMLS